MFQSQYESWAINSNKPLLGDTIFHQQHQHPEQHGFNLGLSQSASAHVCKYTSTFVT